MRVRARERAKRGSNQCVCVKLAPSFNHGENRVRAASFSPAARHEANASPKDRARASSSCRAACREQKQKRAARIQYVVATLGAGKGLGELPQSGKRGLSMYFS
jgi:hypothetical protein